MAVDNNELIVDHFFTFHSTGHLDYFISSHDVVCKMIIVSPTTKKDTLKVVWKVTFSDDTKVIDIPKRKNRLQPCTTTKLKCRE